MRRRKTNKVTRSMMLEKGEARLPSQPRRMRERKTRIIMARKNSSSSSSRRMRMRMRMEQ